MYRRPSPVTAEPGLDPALPLSGGLSQREISRYLDEQRQSSGGRLDVPLNTLESWSRAVGYFDHIQKPNEVLVFPSTDLGVELRLQINYSRLGYQAPPASCTSGAPPGGEACPLCFSNVDSNKKPLLRAFELPLRHDGKITHFAHMTPFPLSPGHFVLNRLKHEPMRMDGEAVRDALEFLSRAPGWLVVSNSDVEWAGASVLIHHHAQVFRSMRLPMESAAESWSCALDAGVTASELRWPGPVLKVSGPVDLTITACDKLIAAWKQIHPAQATCNFLARIVRLGHAVVYLVWRHPDFRTSGWIKDIKAEGVGIVEMAGEVIVPPVRTLSDAENTKFFRNKGNELISSLIQMNSPKPEQPGQSLCRRIIERAFN